MTAFGVTTDDGAHLLAAREGAGPPLVLVSGLGGTAAFWRPVVAALAGEAEVITFSQRGIAGSGLGSHPVTIDRLADDVAAVMAAAGVARATVIGHSTGGCMVQALARRAPERVARLGLSGTWLAPSRFMTALFTTRRRILASDPDAYAALAALSSYPPGWLEENFATYEAAVDTAPRCASARRVVDERIGALLSFDGRSGLDALAMPALIIGAQDDMVVPAFLQRGLAAALPHARFVMLSGGGHFFPRTRTADFADAVRALMASD
ncbi:alpha/beta fold hydrolase [Acuticoccus mangrovi]|uniref:Alpha/beta fold hydrolase n=1 Tax=Acuticoccus mangrovi TaxID=2796142 RepID=A0A934INX5_9HYPH|nr:alpha/beta fold hydrolase [Acuticoccus mangrovi]MBJ3775853.1 alpha/beta fold hydrolase [Acuticoccus mangrovi]